MGSGIAHRSQIAREWFQAIEETWLNRKAVKINAYACMKELNALYLTQADGEYYINSDIPFADTYELRVRVGEKIYIITVTDTAESTDLSDFLQNAVVTGATQDSEGRYQVESGKEYSIILTFAEGSAYQFNNTGTLT